MAESNVKTFTVTAEAASTIGGTRKRKRRTTAKAETMKVGKEQHGGTSPGTSLQVEANRAPGGAEPPSANFTKSSGGDLAKVTTESSPAPVVKQAGGTNAPPKPVPAPQQGGVAKAVKVILEKKKKGTKVVLAPTKVKKLNSVTPAVPAKTRKVAKKIRISLNGFGKRVTRATTIKHESKKQKIEDIKKTLVEAKLIKETSKAPEGVLRTMYADYMTLKNRAL
jgi:hypothetical protein